MSASTQPHAPSASLPVDKGGPEKDSPASKEFSAKQLLLGAFFGVIFGFLLQKGGVAKYHILLGALLLEDFTVPKLRCSMFDVRCSMFISSQSSKPAAAPSPPPGTRSPSHPATSPAQPPSRPPWQ